MKKSLSIFLIVALLFTLTACDRDEIAVASSVPTGESAAPITEPVPTVPETNPTVAEEAFSFSNLEYLEFHFNSGAGSWGTVLVIHPDGSFSGTFQDSNMGIQEPEYPNGSVSLSDFSGQFSQPVWVNDYTCTLKISDIRYEKEPGTSEIRDGILYCYDTAYGLTETEELLLYLPGAPLAELPEDYLPWADLYEYEGTELPHYGLYNPGHKTGFYSLNILDTIRFSVETTAEEAAAEVDTWLEEAATQADMNYAAQQKYLVWDNALNQLWWDLQQLLSEEEMRQLTREELQWIEEKEQAALDSAGEYEGGSLYPTVYYGALADLTKQRVYELLELLPDVS